MGTRVLMSVEEYRRTSFDDGDRDYLDGEVVERNVGELPHSYVTRAIIKALATAEDKGCQVYPEIRIQISSRRFRVADVAVWRSGDIGERIPTVPPFLVVEIVSYEDRLVRMQAKIKEYLSIGVEYVWVIDPDERIALLYTPRDPGGSAESLIRVSDPAFEIALEQVLPPRR